MELIRRWVLVLCVSAVLASVLQSVLPEKGSFSVIKLVLSLYILITLISPVREFSAADLSLPLEQAQTAYVQADLTESILGQAEQKLEATVRRGLQTAGLDPGAVSVQLALDENGEAALAGVTVACDGDGEMIREAVDGALGCEAPLTLLPRNGMGETWN